MLRQRKRQEGLTIKLSASDVREFEAYVDRFMAEHGAPGVAVAIARGDDLVYARGFGWRDREKELPTTADTVMGVASITKSFTAAAIARLREEGRLDFTDPVAMYLPGFNLPDGNGRGVTIRHLLTHTAGLPPLPCLGWSMRAHTTPDTEPGKDETSDHEDKDRQPINTIQDLVNYIASADFQLLGQPGEYLSYSNESYVLLGGIIEAATGMNYADYIRQTFLIPLGMDRSTFALNQLLQWDDVTTLYYKKDGEIRASNNWQQAPPYAAGGWLRSSASDLVRFFQMYANGGTYRGTRLLSPQSVVANMADGFKYSLYTSYAHGLRTQPYHGVTLAEHGGSLKGVASNAGFVPEKGIAVAVLCNLSGVPIFQVWLAAVNMMLGLPLSTPRAQYSAGSWDEGQLQRFPGKFVSGEGAKLEVVRDNGGLKVRIEKEDYPLQAVTADTGLVRRHGQDQELRFFSAEDGRVWGIGFGLRIIFRTGEPEAVEAE